MPYKDPEKARQAARERFQRNKARRQQIHSEWVANNKNKQTEYARRSKNKKKIEVMTHYSGGEPECGCCGNTYISHLTIDHIDNDGAGLRATQGKGYALYRWLVTNNFPPGYQVLCWNCNLAKTHLGVCGCKEYNSHSS